MATKSYSISEEKMNELTAIAEKLGYQAKGKITAEKQLIEDILQAVIDSKDWITSDSNIKELVKSGIKTTANLKNRDSDKKRSVEAFEKLEKLIQKYGEEGIKKSKTYYNKTYKVNYNFLVEYEKNHPGVFG